MVAVVGLLPIVVATQGTALLSPLERPLVTRDVGSDSVQMTVSDQFRFTPAGIGPFATGDNVTLTITNLGMLAHTFTLSSFANYTIPAGSGNLTQFFTQHAPVVSVNVASGVGTQTVVHFNVPKLGYYEFVCQIPGHFQSGMMGFLGADVTPPGASPPNTGPGAPVFLIAGGIVALIILAIVLGFFFGRRAGAEHEMPPERLGYPETPTPLAPPEKPR